LPMECAAFRTGNALVRSLDPDLSGPAQWRVPHGKRAAVAWGQCRRPRHAAGEGRPGLRTERIGPFAKQVFEE
jgi:hypothetical protein